MVADIRSFIDALSGHHVTVVGDICLDEYLIGRPGRLSREAPVPVLEYQRRVVLPGAAANPARNIRALGSDALMVGVSGDDGAGTELCGLLGDEGIDTSGVIVDSSRPTTVKTRVLADVDYAYLQQVARIDKVSRDALPPEHLKHLLAQLTTSTDVVLMSDYRGGVVDDTMIEAVRRLTDAGVPVAVDSQGALQRFRGYTLVRSNLADAEASLGKPLVDDASIVEAISELRSELHAKAVVITRGPAGIAAGDEHGVTLIPATNRSEVVDVVGAGDTVIAVLALGLAAGAPIGLSAEVANIAAGIVVRRFGNAVTTQNELRAALS